MTICVGLDLNQLTHRNPHAQQGLKEQGSRKVVLATKNETFMYQIGEVPKMFFGDIEVTETESTTYNIEEDTLTHSPSKFDCLYEGINYFDGKEFYFLDGCSLCQCFHTLIVCTDMNCDSDD